MKSSSPIFSSMRKHNKILTAGILTLLGATSVPTQAVISVTSGTTTLTFDTAPLATDWSTITAGFAAGTNGTTYTNTTQLDAAVAALTAGGIAATLPTSATLNSAPNGPSSNTAGRYNTAGFFLQSRATGLGATVLLGRLSNAELLGFTDLTLAYDLQRWSAATVEQIEGFRVYFSTTGLANSWVNVPMSLSNGGVVSTVATQATFATPGWGAGGNAFLMFVDDNADPGTDDAFTIDNLKLTPTLQTGVQLLKWNIGHGVGGAPGGVFEVSGNTFWNDATNANTPAGFANGGIAAFDQDTTTAAISVPADVAPQTLAIQHAAGTYEFSGAGKIAAGLLTKTGAGTVKFGSENNFTTVKLNGGTTITEHSAALGVASSLTVDGASTLTTTTGLTIAGGIAGVGPLTKNGGGDLTVSAVSGITGAVNVNAGKLLLGNGAGFSSAASVINLNTGASLEVTSPTAATTIAGNINFNDAATAKIIVNSTPESGLSASGLTISKANAITTVGTITKEGGGTVRITGAQTLTNDWTIAGGFLEAANVASLGTGTVTANAGWISANGIALPNNIVLNGGGIGVRSTNTTTPLEDYTGTVTVNGPSFLTAKRTSTFANYNGYFISGVLSGSASLTQTGPIVAELLVAPFTPANTPVNPNLTAAATVHTLGAVTLRNTGNTYSGNFIIESQQILSGLPSTGTGDVFGTSTFTLKGGAVRILDNGTADNGALTYNHAITVAAPTDAVNPGVATVFVDRQTNAAAPSTTNPSVQGAFIGNTVVFPSLAIPGGQSFRTEGANSYGVKITAPVAATGTGDVTFNTGSAPLELAGGLSGSVSLVKQGASTLKVNGATHSGNTTVNAGGALEFTDVAGLTVGTGQTLAGNGTVTGPVTIANGGSVSAGLAGTGNLTLSELLLNSPTTPSSLNFTIASPAVTAINVTGTDKFVISSGVGSVVVNIAGTTVNPGTYTLIDYSGTAIAGVSAFVAGTLPNRVVPTFVNNTANTSVDVTITTDLPKWTGLQSSEWSTASITGLKNWKLETAGTDTDFLAGDRVLFDDSATGTTVDITGADVSALEFTVNNATKAFSFTGSNGVTGATTLVKSGAAKATLNNTNSFTGAVTINGGIISVPAISDSTVAGPLGSGNTVNLSGGTLEFTGATGSTNRAITLGAAGGSVSATTGSLTVAGVVGPVGGGALTKAGAGTVVLTGLTNTASAVNITEGTLQVGDGTALGSIGATAPIAISNNATLAFDTPAAGTLVVPNAISGAGGVSKSGAGTVTLSGATPNTFTGDTVVSNGTLVLSHTDGVDSVAGNIVVETGGTVAYGTTAGQRINHVKDTAKVTINGGTFGSGAGNTIAAPTDGISDTIGELILNSGTFLSGRNTNAPFVISTTLTATGGTTIVQRGAKLAVNTGVSFSGAASLSFDGGSGTAGQISRLTVGGPLSFTGTTVNMNAGPSTPAATPQGSEIVLGGSLTSSGATTINRLAGTVAQVDLNGANRDFIISDTMTFGTTAQPVGIVNSGATPGGVTKSGPGDLVLNGINTYNGDTIIQSGKIILSGTLSGSANIDVQTSTFFDVTALVAGFPLGATQTLKGNGTVLGDVVANGTVSPGASIGALVFTDDLTFGASGIANFEVSKVGVTLSNDEAFITNSLTLAGTLNVALDPLSGALAEGDTFDLFDATTFAGTMNLGTTGLPSNLTWDLTNLGVDGSITVVPEPGSAALLVLGSALLFRRRRNA